MRHRVRGAGAGDGLGVGLTNIGAFHEALNLAAIWRLPVVFVCENNLYGEYSPIASTTPVTELTRRAASYAMPAARVDGNNVLAVREEVAAARARAAAGEGPTMIEAMTYRHMGHSRSDPATYRPEGELELWMQRDPITLFESDLASHDAISADDVAAVRGAAAEAVAGALERALAWPEPEPEHRFDYVWATPA
jgi:acetoin:2,6-dichlorophenolindophenol oxidoreductase subunit alpha